MDQRSDGFVSDDPGVIHRELADSVLCERDLCFLERGQLSFQRGDDHGEHTKTIFSGLTGRSLRADGSYSETREVRAEVYVFALQACRDRERYDPLDVGQWEFRVCGR